MAACTLTPWVSAACFGEGLKYCTDLECCQNSSSQTHLNIEIKDLQKEEIHKWLSVSLPIPLQFELRRTFNQFMRIYSNPIFDDEDWRIIFRHWRQCSRLRSPVCWPWGGFTTRWHQPKNATHCWGQTGLEAVENWNGQAQKCVQWIGHFVQWTHPFWG